MGVCRLHDLIISMLVENEPRIIEFPRKQLLRERVTLLRYLYVDIFVCCMFNLCFRYLMYHVFSHVHVAFIIKKQRNVLPPLPPSHFTLNLKAVFFLEEQEKNIKKHDFVFPLAYLTCQ